MKVLVSDPMSEVGIDIFRETSGIDVDVKTGLSQDDLKKIIGDYEGLCIRSATKVTAEVIEVAERLRVIGRAGIGLDNVDIPAAGRRGIVVMNTPEGNTITTAEHTIAMMMSISRKIPQATASLKAGKWEKKKLKGRELFHKTLGLIGAGHIGRIVADRAMGLKMKVICYDPYIKPETVEELGLEPVSFEELVERSDYISIHTPKTDETEGMINRSVLTKMKQGAMLVNCARGGIVNEDDLFEALESGHLGGAAMDVFSQEPPGKIKVMEHPNFICSPHLGASTEEAQDNVAREVAKQIADYLLHGTVHNAVNVPTISPELMDILWPFATLVERMGSLQTQLAESAITEARIEYAGKISDYDPTPLTTAMLKGMLTPILKDDVNFVNAPLLASDRGIEVMEARSRTSRNFSSLITITVKTLEGESVVAGTLVGRDMPRILRINDFYLEAIPEGHILLIESRDSPGVISTIAGVLGKHRLNISRMQVEEEKAKAQNILLMTISNVVSGNVMEELRGLDEVFSAKRIEL